VTVQPEVVDLKAVFGDESEIAATVLTRALETEATAIRTADPSSLAAVQMEKRLDSTAAAVADRVSGGSVVISHYTFDALKMVVVHPFGPQNIARPGFEAVGTVTEILIDADEVGRAGSPCDLVFAMIRLRDGSWHVTDTVES